MNLSIYNLLNLQLLFPESMIYSKIKNTYLHTVMCYITFRSRTVSVHGTVHVTLVPQDYNGAENVLFPSDIVTSRHNTLLICLWRCWGNKPTVPCGTYNYVRYIILDNKWLRYQFVYLWDYTFYCYFRVDSKILICCKTTFHVMLAAASHFSCLPRLLIVSFSLVPHLIPCSCVQWHAVQACRPGARGCTTGPGRAVGWTIWACVRALWCSHDDEIAERRCLRTRPRC